MRGRGMPGMNNPRTPWLVDDLGGGRFGIFDHRDDGYWWNPEQAPITDGVFVDYVPPKTFTSRLEAEQQAAVLNAGEVAHAG